MKKPMEVKQWTFHRTLFEQILKTTYDYLSLDLERLLDLEYERLLLRSRDLDRDLNETQSKAGVKLVLGANLIFS